MIYVADASSVMHLFLLLLSRWEETCAVYNLNNEEEFVQTCDEQKDLGIIMVQRITVIGLQPRFAKQKVKEIMNEDKKRQSQLDARSGNPPKHLTSSKDEKPFEHLKQETIWK